MTNCKVIKNQQCSYPYNITYLLDVEFEKGFARFVIGKRVPQFDIDFDFPDLRRARGFALTARRKLSAQTFRSIDEIEDFLLELEEKLYN